MICQYIDSPGGISENLGRPTRPQHSRSRSHGFDGQSDNNSGVSRRPSHLRAASYTSHIRSSSRISWDGRVADAPADRTRSPSPARSPARRRDRPRPISAISLPDHSYIGPTPLADRWSYDRERMLSSPPSLRGSRPSTPVSGNEAFEAAFSRPASTFIESRPPSRAPSILPTASPDLSSFHTPSAPTLRVVPPADTGSGSQQEPLKRQSYHMLTSEEMEMLSRPPPPHPPMSASPGVSQSPSLSAPNIGSEKTQTHNHPEDSKDQDQSKPGCMGICEIATAKRMGGIFGAWFMGMVIPLTFGLVTRCLAGGCR
ncbi:hypothetical protein C8A05DRAFT_41563 [Staphylotrichum tortipilum]|uniref:Uncharacterized protein n=1 Tax=Staphylotrichum tortipilum TaxID=2831512 RepID=A0AAN6RWZ1_9PEZI|nr:hypothetical protein C8A05DRAFT_41563 [Staphylotrichum longicolle]